jgi:hypothetical protein
MFKQQFKLAESMFSIVWFQVISASFHIWRLGDRFEAGLLLGATTVFAVLGVIAIRMGLRGMHREGLIQ